MTGCRQIGGDKRSQTSWPLPVIRSLDGKVGELTKGSILIRGWGVLPLVLGIVLTTWPTEIAGWFGAS
jgi:hypothetical protein